MNTRKRPTTLLHPGGTGTEIEDLVSSQEPDSLSTAKKELAFQTSEKAKRAAELILAKKELAFQNKEKQKRAAELRIAN